jgi:hypothetical protein
MDLSSRDLIQMSGLLRLPASYPEYTRISPRSGVPLSRFVEFRTPTSLLPSAPLNQLNNQLLNFFVSINEPLFFSDYPIPDPEGILLHALRPILPEPPVTYTGIVFDDGSRVTVTRADGGAPNRLTGTYKSDGLAYNLALTVTKITDTTSVPDYPISWVLSKAVLSVGNEPQFTLTVSFSPATLLTTIFFSQDKIASSIAVDVSAVVGNSGTAKLTRVITYYGHSVSSETVDMPTASDASPLLLAISPLHNFAFQISPFAPALDYIVGPLISQPQPNLPLAALGSLDVGPGESEAAYVNRASTLAGPSVAALLNLLTVSYIPGFTNLAQWLGWAIRDLGMANLRAALSADYVTYEQWRAKQGAGGGGQSPLRTVMSNSSDGVAQQAIDEMFKKLGEH